MKLIDKGILPVALPPAEITSSLTIVDSRFDREH